MKMRCRVWDLINKRWIKIFKLILSAEDEDGGFEIFAVQDIDGEIYGLHQVDVMWWIGRRDLTGREIYDGDIVVRGTPSKYSVPAVVIYGEGIISHDMYDDHIDYPYLGWFLDGLIGCNSDLDWGDVTIIGNLYETPHLIPDIGEEW